MPRGPWKNTCEEFVSTRRWKQSRVWLKWSNSRGNSVLAPKRVSRGWRFCVQTDGVILFCWYVWSRVANCQRNTRVSFAEWYELQLLFHVYSVIALSDRQFSWWLALVYSSSFCVLFPEHGVRLSHGLAITGFAWLHRRLSLTTAFVDDEWYFFVFVFYSEGASS